MGFYISWEFVIALLVLLLVIIIIIEYRNIKKINNLIVPDEDKNKAKQFVNENFADVIPGLVLSGGGAKGAYQIGCWRALKEIGITDYSALAGTSVGALNAALISQSKYEAAYNIWKNMKFSVVLKSNFFHLVFAFLIRIPFLPLLAFKYLPFLRRHSDPGFYGAISYYYNNLSSNSIPPLNFLVATWRAIGEYYGLLYQVLSPFLSILLLMPFVDSPNSEVILDIWEFVKYSGWIIITIFFLWFGIIKLDRWLAKTFPLFSNQPLLKLLEKHCQNGLQPGSTPVLVTLATFGIYDPFTDRPDDFSASEKFQKGANKTEAVHSSSNQRISESQPEPDMSNLSWREWIKYQIQSPNDFGPTEEPSSIGSEQDIDLSKMPSHSLEYIPHYFELQSLSVQDSQRLILQSAGLPEIFPMKTIAGADYIDGGIVDNTPLLPLVEGGYSDSFIVISLDAKAKTKELHRDVSRLEKLIRYSKPIRLEEKSWVETNILSLYNSISNARLKYGNEYSEKNMSTWHIIPSKSLGNFLTGTLNFFSYKSRALMKLGYYDVITYFASAPSPEKYNLSGDSESGKPGHL